MHWRTDMENAPYNQPLPVRLEDGSILRARLIPYGAVTAEDESCDQWVAEDDYYPPCWTDGACWQSNAEEELSRQPVAFLAPETK